MFWVGFALVAFGAVVGAFGMAAAAASRAAADAAEAYEAGYRKGCQDESRSWALAWQAADAEADWREA